MKITVLGPKESLAEKTGELLLSAKSLADNIVVFPGKRPAHFLRRYLAERRGGALRSPVITSMDGFMDLAAQELGIKGKEASALDLAGVLYGRLKKELCGVIARDAAALTLDSFLPWALKLTGDFEELKIELKTARDLSGYDSILPGDLRSAAFIKKLESFSRLYGDFYKELEKEGLLTRSVKYARVAEEIGRFDAARYENIVFAGFFALSAAEKAVLKHLGARGAQVILEPGPGLEEQFAFLGYAPAAVPPGAPAAGPALHFYKAPDTHGEIFKLAEVLKSSGGPQPAADGAVIVLPDPAALFPLIENALPAAGDYNISMGYPLTATPVYALLDALGDLLDKKSGAGYFAPNYLKFVFHPYIKNIYLGGAAEPGRIIFQTVEEYLSGRMNKYVETGEIEDNAELLRAAAKLKDHGEELDAAGIKAHLAAIHKNLIAPFEELRDLADFAGKLLAFLSYISEHSTAPLHAYWAPFAEKAIEHIIELKNSRLAGESFAGAAGYFKFFKTFIQGAGYPFPGTPLKGLQVLGALETRGLRFRRVYFLDANADLLPAARKEDTILSHFVRAGLGLSTYKTRERLSRYYFNALISGADEAHIFYRDSADKERSPFVEKLIWDLERKKLKPDESEVHLRIDFSQREPKAIAKTTELAAALQAGEFSPSALDSYLNCGLQFYYRYGLRLGEKDEIAEDLEQRDIGNIAHEVLENFFKARAGKPLNILEKDYGLIIEEAGRVFDAKLKGHNAGFEYLVKRQVERRLRDILDYHRARLAGITVLDCETKLTAELPTKYGTIKLKGRADRVDLRGGVVHILDYKTGVKAAVPNWQKFDLGIREDWPATLKSTQLPFYILAYLAGNKGADVRNMDASLMLLGAENITEETLYKERYKKAPDKAAVFGSYKAAITALIEEILDTGLPFRPPADESSCAFCSFRNLCGRQWVD
ncbi:MAG TPA: PD-(D/E)XK nuclease family protein [Elusimicrobiales bacterium]|nr:PD-(D/E)XK nuclease family protein [Elusimicrobiales bacterium]